MNGKYSSFSHLLLISAVFLMVVTSQASCSSKSSNADRTETENTTVAKSGPTISQKKDSLSSSKTTKSIIANRPSHPKVAITKKVSREFFSKDQTSAWKNAGASVGWLRIESGHIQWVDEDKKKTVDKNGYKAGDIPAFYIRSWEKEEIKKLPVPNFDFGLNFSLSSYLTDNSIKDVASQNVVILDLEYTRLTNTGLQHLANLKELRILDISGTKVSDDGFEVIVKLENLEMLWLNDSDISDKSIPHLSKMSRLRLLNLISSKITAEGAKKLRIALPNCNVIHVP